MITGSLRARVGLGLSAALAVGLLPLAGAPAVAAQPDARPTLQLAQHRGDHHSRYKHKRCPYVAPWTGKVTPCLGKFTPGKHADLLGDEVWSPHFEPTLRPFGRAGSFFVYVGDTPVGWVDMNATGDIGGTITLSDEWGSYVKGTQKIALYDSRGRLVAWDWITIDWDW